MTKKNVVKGFGRHPFGDDEEDIVIPPDETPEELFKAIEESFIPAKNFAEATDTVSVFELWQQIKDQVPDGITMELLPKALSRLGFINKNLGGVILYAVRPV